MRTKKNNETLQVREMQSLEKNARIHASDFFMPVSILYSSQEPTQVYSSQNITSQVYSSQKTTSQVYSSKKKTSPVYSSQESNATDRHVFWEVSLSYSFQSNMTEHIPENAVSTVPLVVNIFWPCPDTNWLKYTERSWNWLK